MEHADDAIEGDAVAAKGEPLPAPGPAAAPRIPERAATAAAVAGEEGHARGMVGLLHRLEDEEPAEAEDWCTVGEAPGRGCAEVEEAGERAGETAGETVGEMPG